MKPEQAEARQLETFLETGQTLAGTYGLKGAICRVLETLDRHHGMMRGVVMLLDPDTHEMRHMRRRARQVRRTFEYEMWIAFGDLAAAGNVLKDEEDEAYAPKPD